MRYDYFCSDCNINEEREVPVAYRDQQCCDGCRGPLYRIFEPADICIPSRFRVDVKRFLPTYEECAALDKRNEEYLSRPKEPEKPSFDECLTKECEARRVNPHDLNQYRMNEVGLPK